MPEAVAVPVGDEGAGPQPTARATTAMVTTRRAVAMPGSLNPLAPGGNPQPSPTRHGARMHQFNRT
jgi:hypothetical protein